MSTLPPEPPTRRIDPVAPPPPVYERVVEPGVPVVDPNVMYVRLEDAISSLRTALVFVGVIAVIAAGIAVYALTKSDDSSSRGSGTSSARISQLDGRVDRLSRQVQQARSAARGITVLSQRVDSLSRQVATVRGQSAKTTAAPDPTQAIQALNKRLSALEQTVQSLSSSAGTTTPP